jgi:ATP-dependent HslUV protease ATP-binding subunit HslU
VPARRGTSVARGRGDLGSVVSEAPRGECAPWGPCFASTVASQVVARLDDYIVGQGDAKRAIAIALRNRWRRMRVRDDMREEIMPKNILMIGPTGCGKTEISRRLAKFANAPFVKVEATKFTEVGYHGRDVDTIVRDLVEASATLVKELRMRKYEDEVQRKVERKLLKALLGPEVTRGTANVNEFAKWEAMLREGLLEDRAVEVMVPDEPPPSMEDGMEIGMRGSNSVHVDAIALQVMDQFTGGEGGKSTLKKMSVRAARPILTQIELERRVRGADVKRDAVRLAEEHGIVVIDEIDKIVKPSNRPKSQSDASDEGVQRDLLPLLEGTTIEVPKFGNVRTDHVLFVCSGAFHSCKPADMLAELQGRLPIRVELKGLTAEDMYRILTEPKANLLEQQKALLGAEGVILEFDDEAVREIANRAAELNKSVENIGARRLNTVIERVMDDISFEANLREKGSTILVTKAMVDSKLDAIAKRADLARYVI